MTISRTVAAAACAVVLLGTAPAAFAQRGGGGGHGGGGGPFIRGGPFGHGRLRSGQRVLWQDGDLLAYGAGLLSSYAEIEVFRLAEVRPWDLRTMGRLDYDITQYQPVLFAAPSFDWLVETLASFFAGFDDDTASKILAGSPR